MGKVHHLFTTELILGVVPFGKFQCVESSLVTSRVPEVVRVDMQGVRQTKEFVCLY